MNIILFKGNYICIIFVLHIVFSITFIFYSFGYIKFPFFCFIFNFKSYVNITVLFNFYTFIIPIFIIEKN